MKEKDIPQDPSILDKFTREVTYATDDKGNYTTQLSRGWEVKASALDISWDNIAHRVEEAHKKVVTNMASPILFFLELRIMDLPTLSAYTGFWKWKIKRHMKPGVFKKLSDKKLKVYADVFETSVETLKNFSSHPEIGETLISELKKSVK